MGRTILAGDQVGELGEHPGQSRSGDRRHGCRDVGCGGCERHAAHLCRLPRRICSGCPANWLPPRHNCPDSPGKREESCARPGKGDCPHIRLCEAVSDHHSALGLRAAPGPTVVARAVEIAVAVEIAFAVALTLAVAVAVEIAFAVAFAVAFAFVIPVSDGLRPMA